MPNFPRLRFLLSSTFALALCVGCDADVNIDDAGANDAGPVVDDAGAGGDAGANDAGAGDAGVNDAGANDAGANDAGANDAGVGDAGANDAGANDAGANDAGANDAGVGDAGENDAGENDAGVNDAGANDAGDCQTVTGDLSIADAAVLATYANLCVVTGDLELFPTSDIVDLAMLSNLETVGGDFTLRRNTALTTAMLPALTTVGGTFEFTGNDVATLLALPALVTSGDIVVDQSALLTNVRFPQLTASTGANSDGSFTVEDLPRLETIEAPLLETTGYLQINECPNLTRINFPALTTLTVAGVAVSALPQVESLELPLLTSSAGLSAVDMAGLTEIVLPLLETVTSSILVNNNVLLETIDLEELTVMNGQEFWVNDNDALATLSFEKLETISGWVRIRDNVLLEDIDFSAVTTSMNLHIEDSIATSIEFSELTTVVGSMRVVDHTQLTTLQAPKLLTVSGTVNLNGNPSLATCDLGARQNACP